MDNGCESYCWLTCYLPNGCVEKLMSNPLIAHKQEGLLKIMVTPITKSLAMSPPSSHHSSCPLVSLRRAATCLASVDVSGIWPFCSGTSSTVCMNLSKWSVVRVGAVWCMSNQFGIHAVNKLDALAAVLIIVAHNNGALCKMQNVSVPQTQFNPHNWCKTFHWC